MKRFILITIIGTALILIGHGVLALCLHPTHFLSLEIVLQGAVCFVVGTAVYISGMLGLADGYENAAVKIFPLFKIKQIEGLHLAVGSTPLLHDHNRLFWQSYKKVTGSVFLFLLSTFGLTFVIQPLSPVSYVVGLGSSAVILGLPTIYKIFQSLRRMRRIQAEVTTALTVLSNQPDLILEQPVEKEATSKAAYQIFRRGDRVSTRHRAFIRSK